MEHPYIHTENLCFSYTDSDGRLEHPALDGISVDIREGEYVAVLGHNGSGKSTFAKLLNLILEPTSGRLVIGGVELTGKVIDHEQSRIEEQVFSGIAVRMAVLKLLNDYREYTK